MPAQHCPNPTARTNCPPYRLGFAICLLLAVVLLPARAATNDLTTAIQRGLFEEEANQNLGAAIQAYQSVASQFDKDRKLAATAIFRLGECYRKQGNTNDAATQYERILRDFSDQPTLVTLSRQNLAVLGTTPPATAAPVMSDAARQEQKRLLEEEIKLVQKQLDEQKQRVQGGTIAPGDLLPTEREILQLKRQVAALDAGLPISFSASGLTAPAAPSEADEVRRIQALTKDSPDLINAPVENGLTLLQSAAKNGKLAVVKALLENGAAVDGLRQPGLTPLHFAANNGHKAVVDLLLSKGAKADARSANGITPLHLAAGKGYESVAKALLAAGAPVNAQIKGGGANWEREEMQIGIFGSGETPLLLAAKGGYTGMVELLLAKGADANAADAGGRTALHLAVNAGYAGMVELLLAKGADVNAEDGERRTPLSYAVQKPAILQLLLAAHANPNTGRLDLPLAAAAYYGDVPALKLLLANGANPNTNALINWSVSPRGYQLPQGGSFTPLFLAVSQRHPDAAKELLRSKANPNVTGPSGNPLLYEALSDPPMLKVLLDGGADPNASNQGTPLLMQAVLDKNQPAVELLLAHKADVNAARSDGWSPLLSAVAGGDKAIAELLIKAGAAVDARNKDGHTPLWVAVERNRPELAELLLANKADPNEKNTEGNTPLHLAVGVRQQELVELLLANKADPNARNNAGQTPLDLAKSQAQGLPPGVTRLHPQGMAIPQPMPTPSQPMNITFAPPGAPAVASQQESKPETMVDLLRQHGALDDLPQLDRITVQRLGIRVNTPFTKGAHDWSQFTLLDLIGVQYGFLAASPNEGGSPNAEGNGYYPRDFFHLHNSLPFPALAHLRIRRPASDMKRWEEQVVDLSLVLGSGDCSKDVRLGWGDVVEVPETDHPLNEKWPGFSRTELVNLKKCLTRQVEIVVKGQATNITLAPQISNLEEETQPAATPGAPAPPRLGRRGMGGEPIIVADIPFWLKPVLFQFKLVLTSSDLSRVKVTRRDSATGQERHWVVDCSDISPAPDLWLRDGDKVEVPEKGDASAAAAGSQSAPK